MTTAFFVQNNLVDRVSVPVAKYAHSRGISLLDRSSTAEFNPDECGIDWSDWPLVLPYGSVQFLRKLRASSLRPFVWHSPESFCSETWASSLGHEMLNQAGRTVSAHEVELLLAEGPLHVRPLREDKAFHAKCFSQAQWQEHVASAQYVPDLPCWASPARDIRAEWRCWIVGGQVVGASQYRQGGEMRRQNGAPREVLAYAAHIAQHWLPAPCVVMDVAQVTDRLHVIEFNPIHGSGWYAVDVGEVLDAWVAWSQQHFLGLGYVQS